ncbi:MAG: HAD family hydrolase [Planctomycetota bacterium]
MSGRQALALHLQQLGLELLPSADDVVDVCTPDSAWLCDALAGLGIAVQAIDDGCRISVPADANAVARLQRALAAALAPDALLLDLDGVLADIEGRRALVEPSVVQSLAARWPLGVVTSCPRRLAESVLGRHGFAPFVRTVVCSEDGPGKPDPAPVRLALQRLEVTSAWMLGDNPSDVQAARAAGVVPLAIAPHGIGAEAHAERLRAAGAARLVPGPADVLRLVKKPKSPHRW